MVPMTRSCLGAGGSVQHTGTMGIDAPPITVMIVDDHDVVALGLRALLETETDLDVVAVAHTVADAVDAATRHRPDVVLMDYRLPDGTGADATRQLQALDAPPAVVMVTSVADRRVLSQALDAGCTSFVSKNADRTDLLAAVRRTAADDAYFSSDVLTHLVHLRRFDEVDAGALSAREVEVLQLTADGLSPESIASQLYLSTHTVKNHVRHAMAKLDAHTKLEAVVLAVRARLISIDA